MQRIQALESELGLEAQRDQQRAEFAIELQEELAQDMDALQRRIAEVEQSRFGHANLLHSSSASRTRKFGSDAAASCVPTLEVQLSRQ